MEKNLTHSAVDRQNILNNHLVLKVVGDRLELKGLLFESQYLFTTKMVADYYGVDVRTIKRQIEKNGDEIGHNGYAVLKGKKLKEFKELFGPLISANDDDVSQRDINVPLSMQEYDNQSFKKIKALAVFNFRAVLNIGMLLTESEQAKIVRSLLLDIVIDTINKKMGGSTKYINQRDEEFLVAITREPVYRKEFTQALNNYLDMGTQKYAVYTNAIYTAIFKENASEYKRILKLKVNDNVRDTMYAEVLRLISSFEVGIADAMREKYEELGRKLRPSELNLLIERFANQRLWIPQIEDAREKMASRDYGFRDVIHQRLENYIKSVSKQDFERFLGDKSKSLIERIAENPELLNVFKRLKDL